MTLFERLFSFRTPKLAAPDGANPPVVASSLPILPPPPITRQSDDSPEVNQPVNPGAVPVLLPYWLADTDALRDEGVLLGLSDAGPDEKLAEIRAYFERQAIPLQPIIEQLTDQLTDLNRSINEHESHLTAVRHRRDDLRTNQSVTDDLPRTVVSLLVSIGMSVGTFYLIDETLRPVFPNRWIAVGVFLAGMFSAVGRPSIFHETESRLTIRRLIEEAGLPLAASVFVLAQALQTQPLGQAGALFLFVFFLFLLTGKRLSSTLTTLRTDLAGIRLRHDNQRQLPLLEAESAQRSHVDALRERKRTVINALRRAEADLAQVTAQRDQFVNLFLGEFELARSLRDRFTQRKAMMNYE